MPRAGSPSWRAAGQPSRFPAWRWAVASRPAGPGRRSWGRSPEREARSRAVPAGAVGAPAGPAQAIAVLVRAIAVPARVLAARAVPPAPSGARDPAGQGEAIHVP